MSSFLDLPDELILEVLSYTETADVLKCGQLSKRIRTISDDNSLFQTVNLVLLKNPGAPLANRSAPGFFSRFHRKFLAQNLKVVRIQIQIST